MEIIVKVGDITRLDPPVDAIVNAANEAMRGGGGVDGAIHKAAGVGLYEEEKAKYDHCDPGDVKVTLGHNINTKYILHTVGPRYYYDPKPAKTLESCYLKCLEEADKLGLESIAFCSISTGIFGYPVNEAAIIAAKTITSYKAKSIKTIYMIIYNKDENKLNIYKEAFNKYNRS